MAAVESPLHIVRSDELGCEAIAPCRPKAQIQLLLASRHALLDLLF
jgi:hypothetical protein